VHIPATHDQAYLVSIPRDLLVDIPAFEKTGFRGGRDKINAAFAFGNENKGGREGGFELLGLTIKQLTGIEFNAGAIIDFGGFQSVVNALGGVDMCVDEHVVSHHIGYDKNGNTRKIQPGDKPVVYEPGCYRLKPWQALDYVRQRYGLPNGDYDRQRHQQQFLRAVLKEAKKQGVTSNPLKLYNIVNAAGRALTVDTNGISIDDWLFAMRGVINNDLVMLKTNGGKINSGAFNGSSIEQLTDESKQMFEAVKSDTLDSFVVQHPDFVSTDALGG
jgi:LCP family protein required for cell wall assembly